MLRRTTYGTTGARIIILFTVNGVEMGNSTTIAPEQQPVIRACIGGTAAFQEITLYRYRKEQWTTPYVETDTGTQFRDFEFSDTEAEAPAIYYLRVRQVDGELAWSSPVWIDTES